MNKINIGILGIGRMGMEHAQQINSIESLNLKAVSSSSAELLNEARGILRNVDEFLSHENIIKSDKLDWIVIATHTAKHKFWALKALECGKNLIVEKPLALDLSEAEEIYNLAERKNLKITVHQNRRWDTDFLLLRDIMSKGILGNVFRIESRYTDFSLTWGGWGAQGMKNPWRLDKAAGGGLLNDWATHLVDQIVILEKSEIKKITSKTYGVFTEAKVDDHFWAEMEFVNGIDVRVEASHNMQYPLPRWNVLGDKGSFYVPGGTPETWDKAYIKDIHGKEKVYDISQDELSTGFYDNFVSALKNNKDFEVKKDEVLRSMTIIDKIRADA